MLLCDCQGTSLGETVYWPGEKPANMEKSEMASHFNIYQQISTSISTISNSKQNPKEKWLQSITTLPAIASVLGRLYCCLRLQEFQGWPKDRVTSQNSRLIFTLFHIQNMCHVGNTFRIYHDISGESRWAQNGKVKHMSKAFPRVPRWDVHPKVWWFLVSDLSIFKPETCQRVSARMHHKLNLQPNWDYVRGCCQVRGLDTHVL